MTSPYLLPDWLPWWIALILLLIALIYALILLLVPFSVFGVKPRLEAIEEQLLAMQEDLRAMAPRRNGVSAGLDETLLPRQPRGSPAIDPAPLPPIPAPPRGTPQRMVNKRIEPRLD